MNWHLLNIVIGLIGFCLFAIVQAFVINGIYECFKGGCREEINKGKICSGNIFYKMSPSFFERHKGKNWTFPIWGCAKCMSSVWGSITFWCTVLPLFGFNYFELVIWIMDMFVLVILSWLIYKKV